MALSKTKKEERTKSHGPMEREIRGAEAKQSENVQPIATSLSLIIQQGLDRGCFVMFRYLHFPDEYGNGFGLGH